MFEGEPRSLSELKEPAEMNFRKYSSMENFLMILNFICQH